MSRSRPTQIPLSLPPRPIPRVELAHEPPTGCRWLGVGERFHAGDRYVSGLAHSEVWEKLIGQRLRKQDVGAFARPLVPVEKLGLLASMKKGAR